MSPTQFLLYMLALTATAGGWEYLRRQRHVARLRELAELWQMHFSTDDRFRLGPRIAPKPIKARIFLFSPMARASRLAASAIFAGSGNTGRMSSLMFP